MHGKRVRPAVAQAHDRARVRVHVGRAAPRAGPPAHRVVPMHARNMWYVCDCECPCGDGGGYVGYVIRVAVRRRIVQNGLVEREAVAPRGEGDASEARPAPHALAREPREELRLDRALE